jgi:hypothetical protein
MSKKFYIGRISRVRLNELVLNKMPYKLAKDLLAYITHYVDYGDDYFPIHIENESQPDYFCCENKDDLLKLGRESFCDYFQNTIKTYGIEVFMFRIDYYETKNGMFDIQNASSIEDVSAKEPLVLGDLMKD